MAKDLQLLDSKWKGKEHIIHLWVACIHDVFIISGWACILMSVYIIILSRNYYSVYMLYRINE